MQRRRKNHTMWTPSLLAVIVLSFAALSQAAKEPDRPPAGCPTEGNQVQCMLGDNSLELGHVVPPGSVCRDVSTDAQVVCADDGTWKPRRETQLLLWQHSREKRGAAAVAAVAGVVISGLAIVVDIIFNVINLVNQDAPPEIICPVSVGEQAPPLQTYINVEWKAPIATDDKGIAKGPVCEPQSGSRFQEGESEVRCWVQDDKGQMAMCSFAVHVSVHRCPSLAWPEHGSVYCTQGTVLGSECKVACDEGYKTDGNNVSKCTETGWTLPVFRCKPIGCKQVPVVENGVIFCPATPVYETVCQLSCDRGFRLRGSPTVLCQGDDGFTQPGRCEDDESPTFPNGCPRDIEAFAAPVGNLTLVSLVEPWVKDNSGSYNLTCSHDVSTGFTPGRHTVVYRAFDAANNLASCTFQVTIKTISCPAPSFDTSDKNLMMYVCPQGRVVGAKCTVSCKSGYPLAGSSVIICQKDESVYPPTGYWTTHDGTSPECREIPCPELNPPTNGALACDNWGHGQVCSMLCNENYDIPLQVLQIGEFVCGLSTGTWRPTDVVPDCTETRQPESMRLPSKLYYYTGHCPDSATQEQIKSNFIEILKHSRFFEKCRDVPECRVENVLVRCGPTDHARRRRHVFKRSLSIEIEVDFSIAAILPPGQSGSQAASLLHAVLSDVASVLTQEAAAGVFNLTVDGQTLQGEDLSTDIPTFVCANGSLISTGKTCAGCAPGSFFNSSAAWCQDCPLGQYEDAGSATSCRPCPPHSSTNTTGKTSPQDCLGQCRPGWMSDTGLEPCQQCAVGSFQPEWGQRLCQQCPSNSSTPSPGATSPDQCLELKGCDAKPCGNHSCVTVPGGWQCQCHGGWSGRTCSTPPDLCLQHQCQNGATCVNGLHNYSCLCERGFKGELCSVVIRNGGWSAWSNWTECSVTCGGGSSSRQRSCDSPSPDPDGLPCVGPRVESRSCNPQSCPSCPPLPEGRGVAWNCTQEEEMTSCTMGCREGFVLATPLPVQQCGRVTNYTWPFEVAAEDFVPECSDPRTPLKMKVRLTANIGLDCQTAVAIGNPGLQARREASRDLDCATREICQVDLALSQCSTSDPVTSVNVTLEVVVDFSPGRVNLMAEVNNSTNPSLDPTQRYVELLTSLNRTIQEMLRDPSQYLTVLVGGQQYPPSTPSLSGDVTCPPGSVPAHVACGACGRGTYQRGVQCELCGRGSYADSTGSTSCTACPPGFSTPGLGSHSQSQCQQEVSSSSDDDSPAADARQFLREAADVLHVALAVALSVAALMAVVGVVVIVCYKCRGRRRVGCCDTPVDEEAGRRLQISAISLPSETSAASPPSYEEATRERSSVESFEKGNGDATHIDHDQIEDVDVDDDKHSDDNDMDSKTETSLQRSKRMSSAAEVPGVSNPLYSTVG